MRDYQKKHNGQRMPQSLYRKVLAIVRDYDRQVSAINDVYYSTPNSNSGGRYGHGSPTESKAIKIIAMQKEVDAVNKALKTIPPEYRMPIFDNIRYGYKREEWVMKKDLAHRSTWSRWRMEFLWNVAENLSLI
ncbi:MAG: hypothetical protein II305_06145 [Clostridia bacterium]|nr:hypothetical protein [Clostridia bacterium]MBQ5717498.1 hypothetical protein [Clostridia bacterium]